VAIIEVVSSFAIPGVLAYFVIRSSHQIDAPLTGFLAIPFLFLLSFWGRDGVIWILRWKNEKLVLDGQVASWTNFSCSYASSNIERGN